MVYMLKNVETHYSDTLHEAEQFVEDAKKDSNHEGYEVKSYKIVKKEKKSKGEVISCHYVVEISKVWND